MFAPGQAEQPAALRLRMEVTGSVLFEGGTRGHAIRFNQDAALAAGKATPADVPTEHFYVGHDQYHGVTRNQYGVTFGSLPDEVGATGRMLLLEGSDEWFDIESGPENDRVRQRVRGDQLVELRETAKESNERLVVGDRFLSISKRGVKTATSPSALLAFTLATSVFEAVESGPLAGYRDDGWKKAAGGGDPAVVRQMHKDLQNAYMRGFPAFVAQVEAKLRGEHAPLVDAICLALENLSWGSEDGRIDLARAFAVAEDTAAFNLALLAPCHEESGQSIVKAGTHAELEDLFSKKHHGSEALDAVNAGEHAGYGWIDVRFTSIARAPHS